VDYFTNIGNILSSWSYRFLAPSFTARLIRREYSIETHSGSVEPATGSDFIYTNSASGSPGGFTFSRVSFSRNPDVGQPLPSFEVKVPGMDSLKWVNLLALSKNLNLARSALV
jgi:hypothetical protein